MCRFGFASGYIYILYLVYKVYSYMSAWFGRGKMRASALLIWPSRLNSARTYGSPRARCRRDIARQIYKITCVPLLLLLLHHHLLDRGSSTSSFSFTPSITNLLSSPLRYIASLLTSLSLSLLLSFPISLYQRTPVILYICILTQRYKYPAGMPSNENWDTPPSPSLPRSRYAVSHTLVHFI